MLLSRLLLASSIVLFSGTSFAEECKYTNVNNVIEPSAQYDKNSICNSRDVRQYESLFYYTGPKAACNDNKAAYCTKVENQIHAYSFNTIIGEDARRPLEDQYWVKAFSYCGLNYKAKNDEYCESMAGSNHPDLHVEKNCKPEHLTKLAERVCGGGRSYSAGSSWLSAWCGRNFKNADARSKKLAKKEFGNKLYDINSACSPREISYASSSGSSSSSSTSSSSAPASNDAPTAPAPSGVDDALNKAKKIKDLFNF